MCVSDFSFLFITYRYRKILIEDSIGEACPIAAT